VHSTNGYVVETDDGLVAEGVFAIGEMTGGAFDPTAIEAAARRLSERIAAFG